MPDTRASSRRRLANRGQPPRAFRRPPRREARATRHHVGCGTAKTRLLFFCLLRVHSMRACIVAIDQGPPPERASVTMPRVAVEAAVNNACRVRYTRPGKHGRRISATRSLCCLHVHGSLDRWALGDRYARAHDHTLPLANRQGRSTPSCKSALVSRWNGLLLQIRVICDDAFRLGIPMLLRRHIAHRSFRIRQFSMIIYWHFL